MPERWTTQRQTASRRLVGIFEGLDFRANRAHGDDLLDDAYEYLMRHFATQSGKNKGQFYTPAEVSSIMAPKRIPSSARREREQGASRKATRPGRRRATP